MQEPSFEIREALKTGLRPDARMPRGSVALVEMRNLKPTPEGALSPEKLSYPITDPVFSQDWPYPILKRGDTPPTAGDVERALFFYDGTQLRTVDESDFSTTVVPLWEADSLSTPATLAVGGGAVDVASFSESYWITDGVNLIFKTPRNAKTILFDDATLKAAAVAQHDDRLFLGGIEGTYLSSTRWNVLFDTWRDVSEDRVFTGADETVDTQYIIFSEESGGDVDWPFETLKAVLGFEVDDAELKDIFELEIRDALLTRRIGLIPCRFTGPIRTMKPLGANLIVYGQRGVSIVSRNASGGYDETPVNMRGVPSRGAVAGDDSEHIIIDTDGDLWRFNSSGVVRLGFKEFVASLTLASAIISFDPEFREYWVSDGTATYVLTSSGLGGPVSLLPSSLVRSYGTATLIGTAPTVDFDIAVSLPPDLDHTDSDIVLIRTVPLDFGRRGQKHITTIHIASEGIRDGRATVHYRQKQTTATFIRRNQDKVNFQGVARIDVNLVDGMIEVLGVAPTQDAEYNYIEARYQTDDSKHIRGTSTRQRSSI